MPTTVEIGMTNEIIGITSFDFFVSECVQPPNWVIVANDISFEEQPIVVDLDSFITVTNDCFLYYISGDTGCYCTGTGSTVPPPPTPTSTPSNTPSQTVTPSITPTISLTSSITPTNTITPTITPTTTLTPTPTKTPTPTPIACTEITPLLITGTSSNANIWDGYILTTGANQYNSLCDIATCLNLSGNSSVSMGSRILTADLYVPTSGLSTTLSAATPLYNSSCVQYTQSTFYVNGNFSTNTFTPGTELYVIISGISGNTIYQIAPGAGNNMFISLYATCDYSGGTQSIVGFDVQMNNQGQWVIDGVVEPNLTLQCGVEYNFHICSTGATEFWLADKYNLSDESLPNGTDALGTLDGVYNNGDNFGSIVVTFDSAGTDGGYWYGYNDVVGAAGRIFVNGC